MMVPSGSGGDESWRGFGRNTPERRRDFLGFLQLEMSRSSAVRPWSPFSGHRKVDHQGRHAPYCPELAVDTVRRHKIEERASSATDSDLAYLSASRAVSPCPTVPIVAKTAPWGTWYPVETPRHALRKTDLNVLGKTFSTVSHLCVLGGVESDIGGELVWVRPRLKVGGTRHFSRNAASLAVVRFERLDAERCAGRRASSSHSRQPQPCRQKPSG